MPVTKQMVKASFKCFKFADIINIFPLTLNQKTGKFSYEKSKLTAVIHNVCFGVSFIKCSQLVYALVSKLIEKDANHAAVTILTGLWRSLCITSTFWSYELFHTGMYETILLFNSLEFHSSGNGDTVDGNKKRSFRLRRLVQQALSFKIQELLVIACPYAVNIFVPIYLVIMALVPHWSVFATSLLKPGTWAYWLAIGMEFIAAMFMQINILFLFFFELALQVVHFGNVDKILENRGATRSKHTSHLLENVDECIGLFDYYHMVVKLCNVLFSRVLFTGKLMALSCSIFGTYYVMTHSHSSSPILLIFFTALSIQAIGFYVISCKKLFEVPGAMRNVKNLCASLLEEKKAKIAPWDLKVREYKIKSMPSIGISDGGFRYMDSISTLIFIDFYLNQVISLLLM